MGFWLPNSAGARNDVTQAAPKPTEKQCQNIFNATMSAANTSQDKWMGASINLVKNPANQTGQFSLPGGDGTGAAANRFYPSYFIAAGIPCIDTLTNLGCHRAADGKTCASSSSKVPTGPTNQQPAGGGGPCLNTDNGEQCPCAADGISCLDSKPRTHTSNTCQDNQGKPCPCAPDGKTCFTAGTASESPFCHSNAGVPCPCAADGKSCASHPPATEPTTCHDSHGVPCQCAADGSNNGGTCRRLTRGLLLFGDA